MKSADDWFNDGMEDIKLSWHADYQSELVGDLESAIADFDQALALQSDHVDALIQKGLALARLGRHDEAETALGQAIQLKSDDPELWLQHSKSLAGLGRHEEALTACDEVLRRRPGDPDARFRKAEMLDALGRDTDALAAWDEVLRQPDCRTINFHSRVVQVLTFDVRRLRARLSRAGALARLGRRAEAVVAYREALEEGEPEDYFVGTFATEEEARECLRAREAAVQMTQDEALRDSYWIVPPGSR